MSESDPKTADDHSCTANARPIVDDYNPNTDTPVLSAQITDHGLAVYCECRQCGTELMMEYEYMDAFPS